MNQTSGGRGGDQEAVGEGELERGAREEAGEVKI